MKKLVVRASIAVFALLTIGALLLIARTYRMRATAENPHLKAGDAMLGQAKPKVAIAEYEKALASPAGDEAMYRLAALYETAGDFGKAEEYLKKAREKAPNDVELTLSLARVISATGRVREGFAEARKAADLQPDNAQALALLAALATTKEEAQSAADKLFIWNNAHGKKPSEAQQPATETLVPLAALYQRLDEQDKYERTQGEAKRVGVRDLNFALNLANVYFSMERLEPAEQILIACTDNSPKRAATWLRLAAVEAGLHKWGEAGDALARLDKTLKAHPDTVLLDARVHLGLGKPKEAKAALEALLAGPLKSGPLNQVSRAHFWLAQAELALGDQKNAETDLKASILADADFVTAELALADLYVDEGSPELAAARLTAVVARKPEAQQAYRLLGQARLAAKDAKGAQAAFEKRVELMPEDPEGPFLLASALQAQGKTKEAEKQLERSLTLDPGAFGPLRELVTLLVVAKRFPEAENRVQIELGRKGRNSRMLSLLGDVMFEQRATDPTKVEAAEKVYREAVSQNPGEISAWLALGRLYMLTDQPDRALLMYGEATKRKPDLPDAWMQIAQLHVARGDAAKAELALQQVISRKPKFAAALNNLAYVYGELQHRPDKALEYATRASKAAPHSASIADTYGWALFQAGKPDQALPVLVAASKALPESAEAHFHVGMALLKSGKAEEGRAELTKALSLSGSFSGVQLARATLAGK